MAFKINNLEKLEETTAARGGAWVIIRAVLRSRYFLFSVSFYLLLLIIFSGYVVSIYVAPRGTFGETESLLVLPDPTPPPPPVRKKKTKAKAKDVKVAVSTPSPKSTVTRLTVDAPSTFVRMETPYIAPSVKPSEIKIKTDLNTKIAAARVKRLIGVRDFQEPWGVVNPGNKRYVKAAFTIFQAKYHDGDWNCNPTALPNLMLQIRAWSRDRIKANLYPKVLDIGTEQLFELRPPFIYLTGHKNFKMLDSEVKNIRDYLMLGGAVWADSALAGRRSRFDVAFRREMKRVMPDRDFEIVPEDHVMFKTFFKDIGMPSGMNYYQEPVEMINIGDEVAVIYTLNGYGHFWESRLNKEGKIEWGRVNVGTIEKPLWQYVRGPHLRTHHMDSRVIYRNISDETVRDAYKFGINVVVHLLTRYQKYFRFLPKKLNKKSSFRGRRKKPAKPVDESTATNKAPKRVHKKLGGAQPVKPK